MKRIWAVPVLASILLLGVVAVGFLPQAFAGVPPGDPTILNVGDFKCYLPLSDNPIPNVTIRLTDQFLTDRDTQLRQLGWVCASADKQFTDGTGFFPSPFGIGTPDTGPGHHLTIYAINPIDIGFSKRFTVVNQFGDFPDIIVSRAVILIAPAIKTEIFEVPRPGTPFGLLDQHWLCYDSFFGDSRESILTDQFGPHLFTEGIGILFCNPVEKTVINADGSEGETFPPDFPESHLTCYTSTEPQPTFLRKTFTDQFASFRIEDTDFNLICVESTKILPLPGSIHGMKWNDIDGDGIKEPPVEPGISDWRIDIECVDGFIASTTTDADGNYWFLDIPTPNLCVVSEEIRPLTWTSTTDEFLIVNLSPGDRIEDQNFGNQIIPIPPEDDHYLAYKVKEVKGTPQFKDLKVNVDLKDQFDIDAQTYKVIKPVRLYNPVEKTIDGVVFGINDDSTHYVGYQIKGPHTPVSNILVENQFGPITVDTTKADLLLVPSLKDPDMFIPLDPAVPFTVNHFKCYKIEVTEGTPEFEQREVSLKDQFLAKNFLVIKPTLLCNPVEKTVVDPDTGVSVFTPIEDEDNHLMCYQVKELVKQPKLDKNDKVWTNNQLAPDVFDKLKVKELCLPSEKSLPPDPGSDGIPPTGI